jgi:hypothetical protein
MAVVNMFDCARQVPGNEVLSASGRTARVLRRCRCALSRSKGSFRSRARQPRPSQGQSRCVRLEIVRPEMAELKKLATNMRVVNPPHAPTWDA